MDILKNLESDPYSRNYQRNILIVIIHIRRLLVCEIQAYYKTFRGI